MVTFDSEQTERLIIKINKLSYLTIVILVVIFCLEAAVFYFTANIEEYLGISIALIVVQGVALIVFAVLFAVKIAFGKSVKQAVLNALANAMQDYSKLFTPDREIAFVATYSGDNLTLSRDNCVEEITFNLSGIKKLPKIYSNFGTYLVEYLQGYFALHTAKDCDSVTITDNIGGRVDVIGIVADGKPCKKTDNNYFLKRGLIK